MNEYGCRSRVWCLLAAMNMGLFRSIFAVVCSVAIAASPVAAALKPCCCVGKAGNHQSCHSLPIPKAITAPKACCAKKQSVRVQVANPCACCVKQSLPLDSRTPTVNPVPAVDLSDVVVSHVPPMISIASLDRAELGADPASGPPLLALLCRWLN